MNITVDIKGMADLTKSLDQVRTVVDQARKPALMAGAWLVANAWKQRAIDPSGQQGDWLTGTYASSIQPEPSGVGEVMVGTNIVDPPYPEYLEYGTSRMPAYPTARPAFEESKAAAIDEVADAMRDILAKQVW